jgi:ketosteroid isomerase-like protein
MTTHTASEIVRHYFSVFQAQDRATAESLLSDDFTFSSPRDDHIDKAQYFERCWPNAHRLRHFVLEQVIADGDDVFVRYTAERTSDGGKFRNTEFIRTHQGKIVEVDVYFGRDLPSGLPNSEVRAGATS